jgi:UDP-N-acetylglucosamine diphosphorylase/glucosamine-1-phosphate N-acetyltransferase
METVLVEDSGWEALRPLTWLRPAASLRVGAWTIAERWGRFGGPLRWLCRPVIAPLIPEPAGALPEGVDRVWVRDRWIPDEAVGVLLADGPELAAWTHQGKVWAVRTGSVPEGRAAAGTDAFWEHLAAGASVRALPQEPRALSALSDCIRHHESLFATDLEEILAASPVRGDHGDAAVYGAERIRIAAGSRCDHGVVLDAREGPIVLGERTQVFPHTWIRGPFLCLEDCHLLGGRIGGGTVLGKACRVRGEVEASVFLGHDNKAHDGFVGHSLLGEWVNLGALTTTSDLKNNYGTVHLDAYGRSFDSGLMKVGAFLGDHVKTRIGTMLNTGSVLGLGANVFGDAGVFPKWIRDFSWGAGPGAATYEWDRFLATATVVLSRRGSSMNEPLRTALHAAFDRAREERETHA